MDGQDRKLNVGEIQDHFSIRKLSVGVCSVLLAATMWTTSNSQIAHADTTTDLSENTTEVQSEEQAKQSSDTKQVEANKESTATAKAPTDSELQAKSTGQTSASVAEASKSNSVPTEKPKALAAPAAEAPKAAPAASENKKAKNEETADGVSQQAVQGEVPDLGQFDLTEDFLRDHDISVEGAFDAGEDYPAQAKLEWVNEPDVSKVGTTTGTARLTYQDTTAEPDENGNYPTKSVLVKIKYNVRAGQKKGTDQVRNTLTYVDKDDNDVVASYTWLGKKAESESSDPVFAIPFGAIDEYNEAVKSLGYTIDQAADHDSSVVYFGTKDATKTVFVKKLSDSDQPLTVGQAQEKTDNEWAPGSWTHPDGYNNLGYVDKTNMTYNIDPTVVIANAGTLPAGTKFSWEVAPTYNFTIDSSDPRGTISTDDPRPTNDPVIKVEEPGKAPILVHLTDADKEFIALPAYGEAFPEWKEATTTVSADPNSVSPFEFLANPNELLRAVASEGQSEDGTVSDAVKQYFLNPKNWVWEVQPDLSHPGVTVGYAKFVAPNPEDTALGLSAEDLATLSSTSGTFGYYNGFMIHVLPITSETSQTKTRTIIVENPDGTTNTIKQTVTFNGKGTQDLVNGPVSYTWDKESGQWDAYTAPAIAGYTALGSPVAAENVTLATRDQTVYITYVSDGDPDHHEPTTPVVKEEDKHADPDEPAENTKTPEKEATKKQAVKKSQAAPAKLRNVKTAPAAVKTNQKAALPQTGAKKSSALAIGLGLIGLALAAGFMTLNRKRQ